jgi:hypothetical protein
MTNFTGKTKRSISRANDPKLLTPTAIYQTSVAATIDPQKRINQKSKGTSLNVKKAVNKTIEIESDL